MDSTPNELYRELVLLRRGGPAEPPAGYRTSQDWGQEWGIKAEVARRLMMAGIKAGRWERTRIRGLYYYGPKERENDHDR